MFIFSFFSASSSDTNPMIMNTNTLTRKLRDFLVQNFNCLLNLGLPESLQRVEVCESAHSNYGCQGLPQENEAEPDNDPGKVFL